MVFGPRVKMLFGVALVVLGVWWYIPDHLFDSLLAPYSLLTNVQSLIAGFQAAAGVLAVIIGLFIIWIEYDQIRLRRELQSQEVGHSIQRTVQTVAEGGGSEDADEDAEEDDRSEDEDGFSCDECGKTFESERGLNVHRSKTH